MSVRGSLRTDASQRQARRGAGGALLALGLWGFVAACGGAATWQPAPGAPLPPPAGPEGVALAAPVDPGAPTAAVAPSASGSEAPLDPSAFDEPEPAAPVGPEVSVVFEPPYKLEERPVPKTLAAQKADLLDRRRWNDGGLGSLLAEQPGPEGHPDPRVRVNIDEARGGRKAAAVQRHARQYHWINVVRCYRLGAYKDAHLRGWTKGRFVVSRAGKVSQARMRSTELKDKAVAKCVIERLRKLRFPPGKGSTRVKVSVKVSPGDDPMPPPEEELLPGDGTLSAEQMLAGVQAGQGAFEACFRAGLEYAPELWGRIPIRFHVTERGTLDEAFDNGGRFPDARVKQCVLREARKLSFPRPKDGDVRFIAPVRLSSDRSAIPAALQ